MEEQYLTEKHYLVCSKGMAPKQMKVTSQKTTYMSGHRREFAVVFRDLVGWLLHLLQRQS
jgi:hypothetical protein